MATVPDIEERVAHLETRMAQLERQIEHAEPEADWLLQSVGAFKKYSSFDELVRLGREFRESQPYADEEHPV